MSYTQRYMIIESDPAPVNKRSVAADYCCALARLQLLPAMWLLFWLIIPISWFETNPENVKLKMLRIAIWRKKLIGGGVVNLEEIWKGRSLVRNVEKTGWIIFIKLGSNGSVSWVWFKWSTATYNQLAWDWYAHWSAWPQGVAVLHRSWLLILKCGANHNQQLFWNQMHSYKDHK